MKIRITFSFASLVLLLALTGSSLAQSAAASSAAGELYLISAKAGAVNYLEGMVSVSRKDGRSSILLKRDSIEDGDAVETGADGRAEILLNPGSFVRLAQNSRFSMIKTSLDDLRLGITRGAAIFEVYAINEFDVLVETPNTKFRLIESGVYRIDITDNGVARLEVHRGRARLENSSATIVKSKQAAIVNGNSVAVQKFDRGNMDEFETWSRLRGKEAVKANSRLRGRTLTNSLLASSGTWNMYRSFGVWAYQPGFGFCFVPFGSSWYSPYGYWYRRDYWTLPLPPIVVISPPTGTGTGQQVPQERRQTGVPPFQRFPQSSGPSGRMKDPTIDSPRIPDAPSTPPIIFAPAPSSPSGRKAKDE